MKYAYTAILSPIEDGSGFYCRVPDINGCISSGKDLPDAIAMITDAAAGCLCVLEDENVSIPTPTPQIDIKHDANDIVTIIQLDTLAYRAANDKRAVRKNVSLPAWMSKLADQRRVNCSQVLQDGLMKIFESA